MDGLARQNLPNETDIYAAEVKSILSGKYLLADRFGRTTTARCAASCLLTPVVGDRVLAARAERCDYILAILDRPSAASSEIALDGDVAFSAPTGTLRISGSKGVTLSTPEDLSLIAGKLGLSAASFLAAFQKIELFGDAVETHLVNLKSFSKRVESKVESAVQQFVSRHVKVDGQDSLNAGTIKQTAKNLMSFQSLFAFIKAKKNVKIDGKQIFMG